MTDEPSLCPVCQKDCSNPGGLAAHLQFTKDADHLAHRTATENTTPGPPTQPLAPTEVAPQTAPALAPSPVASVSPPVVVAEPPALAVAPTVAPTTESGEKPVHEFTLSPSGPVVPLLPPGPPGGANAGAKPPPVSVPLEPIIAGATAAAINGLVLRGEYDGKLGPEKVTGTGFPKAAEACVRFYFPDLPLDHPVAALIISGASLAILVVELKGANKPKALPSGPEGSATQTTLAPTTPPVAPQAGTGDPYWDAILARAGGAPNA